MKASYALGLLGLFQAALSQTLGPSPTESIGCVSHEDHWDCEAARPTEAPTGSAPAAPAATTSAAEEHHHEEGEEDHDHEHEGESGHDHGAEPTDAPGLGSLAPSPTESIGCEPHGNHWHCDGPRVTGASATGDADTATTSGPVEVPGAAAGKEVGVAVVAAAVALQFFAL